MATISRAWIVSTLAVLCASCKFPDLPEIGTDGGSTTRSVTVEVEPQVGQGTVVAASVGINCGTTCTAEVEDGTRIVFTAIPADGAGVVGWRAGARECGSDADCPVEVAGGAVTVGVRFGTVGEAGWLSALPSAPEGFTAVASTPDGGAVVVGMFSAPISYEGMNLPDAGLLIAKLTIAGEVVWQRSIPGLLSPDGVHEIAVHPESGDIALLGTLRGAADFGGPVPIEPPAGDTLDAFVVRLGGQGEWKWQKVVHISDDDEPTVDGVAFDRAGDVYVVGSFFGTVDLGDGALSSSDREAFLARLSSDAGTVVWKKKLGGAGSSASPRGLAVDPIGVVLVGGGFGGTGNFGGPNLTASGIRDGFLAAYGTESGVFRWQKRLGGTGDDTVTAVTSHPSSRFFASVAHSVVAGETVTFAGTSVLGSGGAMLDIVVGGVTTNQGDVVWARRFGGANIDEPTALAVAPDASLLLAGTYYGDIAFSSTSLQHAGSGDGFVARLSAADGAATFAARAASGGFDVVNGATGTSNAIYCAGRVGAQASVFGRTLSASGTTGFIGPVLPTP